MNIANLRAFAAVAECGSFSAAADKLHLTQPAVSKRIALLEKTLGTTLFDRIARRVELTEAGHALLTEVPRVEHSLDCALRSVTNLRDDISGPLRLATSHHIGLHRLPPVLSRFQIEYPQVQLDIEFLDSEQAYDLLRAGSIELAVVTLAPGNVTSLRSQPLWTDTLAVMVSPTHPLARRKVVGIDELMEYPAVLPGMETFTGRIVRQHFERGERRLQVRLSTNYLETLRMMAAVGLGWTVLPVAMADPDLLVIKVRNTQLIRTLGLVQHDERSPSRAAQAFGEMLRETVAGS